jgi:hypothetical protein
LIAIFNQMIAGAALMERRYRSLLYQSEMDDGGENNGHAVISRPLEHGRKAWI